MGAFGIEAICPSTSPNDYHTLGYATERTSNTTLLFQVQRGTLTTGYNFRVLAGGDVIVGQNSELATTATAGFLVIPSCNGAPTGTPTNAAAGAVPLVYDRANEKLYAYNGAWISVTLS